MGVDKFWWDRHGNVVICEILGLSVVFLSICCNFGWLTAENMVDFGIGENLEVPGQWVREKETDRKVRFVPIVGAR